MVDPLQTGPVSADDSDPVPQMTGANPAPGRVVAANLPQVDGYKVLALLGSGGMGDVYRAVQLGTQREVALKLMRGSISNRASFRFDREVQLTARLDHPHIARVFDSGLHHGIYYYAMELITGEALDEFIKTRGMEEKSILELFQLICQALAHAHVRGIIHRDIKPSNIMVSADGLPHIVDFGLAKTILDGESQADRVRLEATVEGEWAGTPAFMSPEQAAGKTDLDTRTDVYSLGVILYILLTGEPPHVLEGNIIKVMGRICNQEVRRPRLVKADINLELESLLLKALAKSPDERYASAGEFARDLGNYLLGEPISACPATTLYFLRKRLWKHRGALAFACGIALAMAITAIAVTLKIVHERNAALAADHRSTLKAAEAESERRSAKLSEASALIAGGDLLGSAQRWDQGKSSYQHAFDLLKAESAWTGGADIGLWNACRYSPPPLLQIDGTHVGIMDMALSGDGRIAFAGAQDGSLQVWDLPACHILRTLSGHRGRVWSVAMTDNAMKGFSGGADGAIKAWDLSDTREGGAGQTLGQLDGWVTALSLSMDGRQLASVSGETEGSIIAPRNDTVTVWSTEKGAPTQHLCRFETAGRAARVAFSPNGSFLLTAGVELALWKIPEATKIGTFGEHRPGVTAIAFSPDGSRICSGYSDGVVNVWDVKSRNSLFFDKTHESPISAAAFSPDGKTLVLAGEDGSLLFRNAQSGTVLRTCTGNHRDNRCFAFSGDGRFAAGVSAGDNAITLWALTTPVESLDLQPAAAPIDTVALTDDGRLAFCAGRDGMTVHDVPTGRTLRIPHPGADPAETWAFSPDHRKIASVSDHTLRLCDFPSRRVLTVPITRTGHQPVPIAFSPDGQTLLSAPGGAVLSLSDARTGKEIRSFAGHGPGFLSVAFSRDGKSSLCGGRDGVAILFDVETGNEFRRFVGHKDGINAVAFSPDGLTVATASGNSSLEMGQDDYSVRRWNVATGSLVQTFIGHTSRVRAVAFSPDGAILASAGDDEQIRFWELQTGRELRTIKGMGGPIHSLAFSSTGILVSGGEDRIARLWDFSTTTQRREQLPAVRDALHLLQSNPRDSGALAALGRWYAFHRTWDWAADILQRATAAGAVIDSTTLARCYWLTGRDDRAIAEFNLAAQKREVPVDYANLCIEAIRSGLPSPPAPATSVSGNK